MTNNLPTISLGLTNLVKNAIGRGAARAFCTGCHGGESFHLMAFVDNSLVHVYLPGAGAKDQFDAIVREIKTLELQHREWFETGMRRWHVEFAMAL